jgi:hypothetical protein
MRHSGHQLIVLRRKVHGRVWLTDSGKLHKPIQAKHVSPFLADIKVSFDAELPLEMRATFQWIDRQRRR